MRVDAAVRYAPENRELSKYRTAMILTRTHYIDSAGQAGR